MAGFYLVSKENQIPQSLQRAGEGAETQVSNHSPSLGGGGGSLFSVTGKTVAGSE